MNAEYKVSDFALQNVPPARNHRKLPENEPSPIFMEVDINTVKD
jgi:hypothetical protein